jgi:hypothetical protein
MELRHMAQKGICGYVANTHQSLISSDLADDNKYNPEVDDFQGNGTAVDILTSPVLCSDELEEGNEKRKGMHLP